MRILKHCAILLFLLILANVTIARSNNKACKSNSHATKSDNSVIADYHRFKAFAETALTLHDTALAVTGFVGMLSCDPRDSLALKMLTKIYYDMGNYHSALICGKRYIDLHPEDVDILKTYALISQANGLFEEALILYTELYFRTKESYFKYFAANCEYELFRGVECLKTIDDCLKLPTIEKDMVLMKFGQGESQWVSVKAACYNLAGLTYMDMKDRDKAVKAFNAAINLAPDFTLALQNLGMVQTEGTRMTDSLTTH